MSGLVIRQADVDGRRTDVRVADGRITAPASTMTPEPGDEVLDAAGGALIPGLHDHHIHLMAFAAARESVRLGPPHVTDHAGFTAALLSADRTQPSEQWVRGTGYHESVAGELDRFRLDALVPHRPVRIQHRSGALWILNTPAVRAARLDGPTPSGVERDVSDTPTGRIYGLDTWLRDRVPTESPDLAAAAHELLSYGVTGLTDATPTERTDDVTLLAAAAADGRVPQHLIITGGLHLPADAAPALEPGPIKLVVADHALPTLDEITTWIDTAHQRNRAVAIHCVTRVALLLALAAWDDAGALPGDRVEHAAVAGPAEADRLACHHITIVTQPAFVADRGDAYLADVDPADQPHLWPCASLLHHGVAVGGSTDAPYGNPDPWHAIAAAIHRRTPAGAILGPDERLEPHQALSIFLTSAEDPGGPPRSLSRGQPADLCLLKAPLAAALEEPSSDLVAATVRQGRLIWMNPKPGAPCR